MTRLHETHRRINAEIAQEKATALGRAGERLESALEQAAALGRRLDASTDPEEQARLLGEYESARVRAIHTRLTLVIQREAVGLRHHRIVDQQVPEPPRRSAARATALGVGALAGATRATAPRARSRRSR